MVLHRPFEPTAQTGQVNFPRLPRIPLYTIAFCLNISQLTGNSSLASCLLMVEMIRKENRESMTLKNIYSFRFAGRLIAALLCLATVAHAGPPLICHTIEIGQARSLPWINHNL